MILILVRLLWWPHLYYFYNSFLKIPKKLIQIFNPYYYAN